MKYNHLELDYIIKDKNGVYSILTPYSALIANKKLLNLGKTYLAYKDHGQDFGVGIGFLTSRELLKFKRKQNLSHSMPKYARLYLRTDENQFNIINMHIDTPLGDSAQALFPEFVNPPPNVDPQINKIRDFTLENGRYTKLHPFMPKRKQGYFLDITMSELARFEYKKDWKKRPVEHFHFLMKDDLNSIIIKDLDSKEMVVLYIINSESVGNIEYMSLDKKYKAILIYRNLNLASVDRLLILSPNYLYEFISCKIGENGCAR